MSERVFVGVDYGTDEFVVACVVRMLDKGQIEVISCERSRFAPLLEERRLSIVKQAPREKTFIHHDDVTGFYQRRGTR